MRLVVAGESHRETIDLGNNADDLGNNADNPFPRGLSPALIRIIVAESSRSLSQYEAGESYR